MAAYGSRRRVHGGVDRLTGRAPAATPHRSRVLGLIEMVGDVVKGGPLLVLIHCLRVAGQPLPCWATRPRHSRYTWCMVQGKAAQRQASLKTCLAAQTRNRTWSAPRLPPRGPAPPSIMFEKAGKAATELPCCILARVLQYPTARPKESVAV